MPDEPDEPVKATETDKEREKVTKGGDRERG
jgi:hypothetical protein